jgi:hypothetical protein
LQIYGVGELDQAGSGRTGVALRWAVLNVAVIAGELEIPRGAPGYVLGYQHAGLLSLVLVIDCFAHFFHDFWTFPCFFVFCGMLQQFVL